LFRLNTIIYRQTTCKKFFTKYNSRKLLKKFPQYVLAKIDPAKLLWAVLDSGLNRSCFFKINFQTPLFNWNVKQLFLYLTAEYNTPHNEVCILSLVAFARFIWPNNLCTVVLSKEILPYREVLSSKLVPDSPHWFTSTVIKFLS
jgi:hypothetical protein